MMLGVILAAPTGKKNEKADGKMDFLQEGIARRNLHKTFQLADHVHMRSAELIEGLLQISLQLVIPEALKPRTTAMWYANDPKTIEAKKAA